MAADGERLSRVRYRCEWVFGSRGVQFSGTTVDGSLVRLVALGAVAATSDRETGQGAV
jgi:hypothetical protein